MLILVVVGLLLLRRTLGKLVLFLFICAVLAMVLGNPPGYQ